MIPIPIYAPDNAFISREQVCLSLAGKVVQFSAALPELMSVSIPILLAVGNPVSVELAPRALGESGARILRMARPIKWPTDDSDTDY